MKIDKERTGYSISVHMDESAEFLRDQMNHAAECMEDIFVPSDVVWNQNQYTFYVSHRQSLKEYIYENGMDMGAFCAFLKKIGELYSDAIRFEIDPHDFIFDYECIFVGSSVYDSEFIYAPDSETYKDGAVVYNKCSDMVAIVSLHIDYAPTNEGAAAETAVSEVIRILSEWEADGARTNSAFPIEQIHLILAKWDTDLNGRNSIASWKWFCIAEGAAACAMLLWFFREQQQEVSGFIVGAWLLLFLCIAYLFLPRKKKETEKKESPDHIQFQNAYKYSTEFIHRIIGKLREIFRKDTKKKEVYQMELNGDMLLKGINYTLDDSMDEIHIGRDNSWADVPLGLTFVSRKHATLYKQNNKWYIEDLKSTNGTFVNGTKIAPETPLNLKNGNEISLGIPETKFIFCLP